MPIRAPVVKARAGRKFIFSKKERHRKASSQGNSVAVRNSAAGKASLKVSLLGNSVAGGNSAAGKRLRKASSLGKFGGGEKFGCGKSAFEKHLRWVIRRRGEIRLREKASSKSVFVG